MWSMVETRREATGAERAPNERQTMALKSALDLCVLSVLLDGPTYGYGLIERLAERGLSLVAEGSVYPLLTRLEKRGLLSSERVPSSDGPPRKYYSITADGRYALQVGTAEWSEATAQISEVLDGR